jgi:hypothetical protein
MSETTTTTTHASVLSLGLIVAAVTVSLALFLGAQTLTKGSAFNDKSVAVQGCFEVAKGTKTTQGSNDNSTWEVVDSSINQEVLRNCLDQKGY